VGPHEAGRRGRAFRDFWENPEKALAQRYRRAEDPAQVRPFSLAEAKGLALGYIDRLLGSLKEEDVK
jgi:hypothetical protein